MLFYVQSNLLLFFITHSCLFLTCSHIRIVEWLYLYFYFVQLGKCFVYMDNRPCNDWWLVDHYLHVLHKCGMRGDLHCVMGDQQSPFFDMVDQIDESDDVFEFLHIYLIWIHILTWSILDPDNRRCCSRPFVYTYVLISIYVHQQHKTHWSQSNHGPVSKWLIDTIAIGIMWWPVLSSFPLLGSSMDMT